MTRLAALLTACALAAACGDPAAPAADATPEADVASPDTSPPDAAEPDAATPDAAPDTSPTGPGLALPEPTGAGISSGLVPVVLAPTGGPTERLVDGLRVTRNGTPIFHGALLPDRFLLDTAHTDATTLTLEAHALLDGAPASDAVSLTVNNRPYRVLAATAAAASYRDRDTVTLDVTLSHPGATLRADFAALDSTWTAGAETVTALDDTHWRVTHRIGAANTRPDGLHRVSLNALWPGWAVTHDHLAVRLQQLPLMPLTVTGAIAVRAPRPAPTGWADPAPALTGNGTMVTGGTLKLTVDFRTHARPADVIGLVLALDDHFGFVQVPLANSDGLEEVRLDLRQFAADETPPSALSLAVALVDRRGNVSPYVTKPLDVLSVGAGDLQISVSWDSPTDVDLHVTGPGPTPASSPCTVYFGQKTCASGGSLDLDSNPACSIDGINNENVFWDTTQAAPGDYTVELRYWSDCSCCAARYTVAVVQCGATETFEGILYQGSSGGDSPKRLITTVTPRDCGYVVTGRARYPDRLLDAAGDHGRTFTSVRSALVEVRRASTDFVLATGATDADGRYRVTYPDPGADPVYVVVRSRTDPADPVRSLEVLDDPYARATYEVRSEPYTVAPSAPGAREVRSLDLDVADADAGAFNIFDQLVTGYDLVRRMTGRQLGALRAFWTVADTGGPTAYCTKALYDADGCIEPRSVTVQGFADDPDAFDDAAILRVFFGFALDKAGRNDSPGGPTDGRRVDPRLAWAEGAALFFAADVLGTALVADGRPEGVLVVRGLERPSSPFARGQAAAPDAGALAPELVAAVLFDLADGIDAEASDPVDARRQGVYDVLFNRLRGANLADRGPAGVDLTDFLDGFVCRGYGAEATLAPILDERAYAYDFAGPATCP